MNSLQLKYPRGIGNRSSYREFRVMESQMLGWVALGAEKSFELKGDSSYRDSSYREFTVLKEMSKLLR